MILQGHRRRLAWTTTRTSLRLVAKGTKPRRAFAVIVYDASQPPTTRMAMETATQLVSCGK